MRIRDLGWRQFGSGIRDGKKSNPGSGINIPDPPHCKKYWFFVCLDFRIHINWIRIRIQAFWWKWIRIQIQVSQLNTGKLFSWKTLVQYNFYDQKLLRKRPPALQRNHSALQTMKFLHPFLFWAIFSWLDPDPNSKSGSTDLLSLNTADSKHWLRHFSLCQCRKEIKHPAKRWMQMITNCAYFLFNNIIKKCWGSVSAATVIYHSFLCAF